MSKQARCRRFIRVGSSRSLSKRVNNQQGFLGKAFILQVGVQQEILKHSCCVQIETCVMNQKSEIIWICSGTIQKAVYQDTNLLCINFGLCYYFLRLLKTDGTLLPCKLQGTCHLCFVMVIIYVVASFRFNLHFA